MSIDMKIWLLVQNGLFVPKTIVGNIETNKLFKDWNDKEIKKAFNDLKARNILISSLSID